MFSLKPYLQKISENQIVSELRMEQIKRFPAEPSRIVRVRSLIGMQIFRSWDGREDMDEARSLAILLSVPRDPKILLGIVSDNFRTLPGLVWLSEQHSGKPLLEWWIEHCRDDWRGQFRINASFDT